MQTDFAGTYTVCSTTKITDNEQVYFRGIRLTHSADFEDFAVTSPSDLPLIYIYLLLLLKHMFLCWVVDIQFYRGH